MSVARYAAVWLTTQPKLATNQSGAMPAEWVTFSTRAEAVQWAKDHPELNAVVVGGFEFQKHSWHAIPVSIP